MSVLKGAGIASMLLGLAIGVVELYHVIKGNHAIQTNPLWAAGFFLSFGALLYEFGRASSVLKAAIPLISQLWPGGRRKTDPPPPDDPNLG